MQHQSSINNTFVINEDIEEDSEPIGPLVREKHLTRQNPLVKYIGTEADCHKMKFEEREAKVKELYVKM
jgi:hypothetical protein